MDIGFELTPEIKKAISDFELKIKKIHDMAAKNQKLEQANQDAITQIDTILDHINSIIQQSVNKAA